MYDKKITSDNPTLMVFLIDQSASMSETMVKTEQGEPYSISRIAKIISDTFLYDAFRRCQKENKFKPYIDLAVIGYGGSPHSRTDICSALPQIPLEQFPFSVTKLADTYIAKNDSNPDDNSVVPLPKLEWIEERADGEWTPMLAAFTKAREIVENWLPDHQESFPPVIINISDGAPNDDAIFNQVADQATEKWQFKLGDVSQTGLMIQSKAIRDNGTNNGKCLVLNCHVSTGQVQQILYPSSIIQAETIDPLAPFMFEMSSIIPESLREYGTSQLEIELEPDSRFFIFNAEINSLLKFMKFGTSQPLADGGSKASLGSNTSGDLPAP